MRKYQFRIIVAGVFMIIGIAAILDHWFYWDRLLSQETYGTLAVVSWFFGAHYLVKAREAMQERE